MSGFVFSQKPIEIERGTGAYLYDTDGTEYLDAGASYACVPVGHSHPRVIEAMTTQAERLQYIHGSYPTPTRRKLFERLADIAPEGCGNVWLCNSGTEANEAAIKFARSATDGTDIVATTRAFHGRTYGSLSATWRDKYKEPFAPLLEDVTFVPFGDEEALADAVDDETAAVIFEPIQGEGGIHAAPPGYLAAARDLTDDAGAALIFDEIQTGLGRTGEWWACQHDDVAPDILTTAKGLANGLPIGATLCRDWIAENSGPHGSTFAGNPVVAAAATETLSIIEEDGLREQAAARGEAIVAGLESADLDVRDVRGRGLMVGVEVKRGANRVIRDLALEHGILALPAGRSVLRLLPPLIVDEAETSAIVEAIAAVLGTDEDGEGES